MLLPPRLKFNLWRKVYALFGLPELLLFKDAHNSLDTRIGIGRTTTFERTVLLTQLPIFDFFFVHCVTHTLHKTKHFHRAGIDHSTLAAALRRPATCGCQQFRHVTNIDRVLQLGEVTIGAFDTLTTSRGSA